jgi:hypothetical protein
MPNNGKKFHQTTGGKIGIGVVGTGVAIFIGVYGFLNNYIDARVTNHPTVQQSLLTQEKMNTLKSQLEELKTTSNELKQTAHNLQIQVAILEARNAK